MEPDRKLRARTGSSVIKVAVWGNGDSNYSATAKKSYKRDDEPNSSQSLSLQALLALADLPKQAWKWIPEDTWRPPLLWRGGYFFAIVV